MCSEITKKKRFVNKGVKSTMSGIKFIVSNIALLILLCQLYCTCVESVSFDEDVTITYDQKIAIDKLRKRVGSVIVEDFMKEDIYLVKYLRSSNFDISLAEKKFVENIRWRKENKIATIEKEDFSDVSNDFPFSNDGYDKEGKPVMIAYVGDWDVRSAVVTGLIKRVLRYGDKIMETLRKRIRHLQSEGKNVTQAVLIVELSQFSVVQHACIQCLVRIVEFLNSYESHFPGMCDKVIFVDAPPAVHFVLELIRQNVSKVTRDTIRVYGTNKEQWKSVLAEYIDKKYLPVEMGGTLERN